MKHLIEKLINFFSYTLKPKEKYSDKTMKEANAKYNFKNEEFEIFINHFQDTLLEIGIKEDLAKEIIERKLLPLRSEIVKKGECPFKMLSPKATICPFIKQSKKKNTFFHKIGGIATVNKIVPIFYEKVLNIDLLKKYFEKYDVEK
jgi:truncated hemoglobin YjbI